MNKRRLRTIIFILVKMTIINTKPAHSVVNVTFQQNDDVLGMTYDRTKTMIQVVSRRTHRLDLHVSNSMAAVLLSSWCYICTHCSGILV